MADFGVADTGVEGGGGGGGSCCWLDGEVDSVEEFEKRRHIVRGVNCEDDGCVCQVCA